jgi:LacI family transcriptional regulator
VISRCIVPIMAVKMKDIARELGVSLVTVSKALRNHPDISKATRERIEAKVKELDYRPNLAARSLVTGRSNLIGFIVPDLIHPFFAEVAKGLSLALREHGYFLIMASSEEDPALEYEEIRHMLAHRLDAMVVASSSLDGESLKPLQSSDTVLVLVDRVFDGLPSHFVGTDDYACGKLATEHLISIGCKRIAHLRGHDNSPGKRRLKGYLDTLARHGLPVVQDYIVRPRSVDVDGKEHGAAALKSLLELKRPPDGIFCYNDPTATGVIMEASNQQVRIPQDLAVIGCGNLHSDDIIRVPLSSIDQRSHEIGRRTAALVIKLLAEDASPEHRKIVLQPRLVMRASTNLPSKKSASKRAQPSR